jgi:hypothetical protein
MNKTLIWIGFAAVGAAGVFACSSSSSSGGTPPEKDGGNNKDTGVMTTPTPDSGTDSPVSSGLTLSGQVVDFSTMAPLSGVTVKAAATTTTMTTTNATGDYSLNVPAATPYTLNFSNTGYATLTEETAQLSAAYNSSDGGPTTLPSVQAAQFLLAPITGLNPSLGSIAIVVTLESTCASAMGTTFTLGGAGASDAGADGGGPGIIYTAGALGLPSPTATSVTSGERPAAIAYNLPLGVPITVAVSGGPCMQDPNPVTQGPITYEGSTTTVASETGSGATAGVAFSGITVFLK